MIIRYKWFLPLFITMIGIAACGKYGYDFQNGWQSGERDGQNPIDTSLTFVDKSKYEKARAFPGLVGEKVHRVIDTLIPVNLDYIDLKKSIYKVGDLPSHFISVGLYAPAGENVKIDVPTGIHGLRIRIGPHLNTIGQSEKKRDEKITTEKELFPGTNYIRNPYGGLIWLYPTISNKDIANLKFSNVVKTSDFIQGVTNQQDWLKDLETNDVPWLELRAKRIIFSVPRELVLRYKSELNVEAALKTWNEMIEKDVYGTLGLNAITPLSDTVNRYPIFPERFVLDIQLPNTNYSLHGWVMSAYSDKYWITRFASDANLLKGEIKDFRDVYHALGHNYTMFSGWQWDILKEVNGDFFAIRGAQRVGIPTNSLPDAVKADIIKALAYTSNPASKKNFINNFQDAKYAYYHLAPFLQIFDKVKGKNGESGFDFIVNMNYNSRNTKENFSSNEIRGDFFYREISKFAGMDFARYMEAWGIRVSATSKKEIRSLYPPLDKAIWMYNPITKQSGDSTLSPSYILQGSDFTWKSNMKTATNESIGSLKALNDGLSNTYWHTCWTGCGDTITTSAIPTELVLDMQITKSVSGVYIQNRQGETYRSEVIIYVSGDGNKYTEMGKIVIAESLSDPTRNARKTLKFEETLDDVRFIKFQFTGNNLHAQPHTAIAEAGAFYDPN
jgi:hypothetical protein